MLRFMEGFDGLATADGQSLSARLLTSGWVDCYGVLSKTDTRTGVGYSMSLEVNSTGGGGRHAYFSTPNAATLYVGFACKFFSGMGPLWRVRYDNLAGTSYDQFTLFKNGVGGLSVLDYNGALLAYSDNNTIFGSTWNYIEFKVTGTTLEVRVNGDTVIDATGVFRHPSAPAIYNEMGMTTNYFSYWDGGTAPYYDDIYASDTAGGSFTTYSGDVVIGDLSLTADATPNDMTPFGVTDHYDALDEKVSDEDTTYLTTPTIGDEENFICTSLPATVQDVLAIAVSTRAKKDGTGYKCFKNQVTIGVDTEVSEEKFVSSGYAEYRTIWPLAPDGGAWDVSGVNSMTVGFQSVATP